MTVVIDASAVLAMPCGERGGDNVKAVLKGAWISSVNLVEVAEFYAMEGVDRVGLGALLDRLPVHVVDVDESFAIDVAMRKPLTRVAGLSLGDRYCLALAARENLPVVTADRIWDRVAETVGVTMIFIR